jgi:hypothetical protein
MLHTKCTCCNKEIISSSKPQACGCENNMLIKDDTITAVDLNCVIIIKCKNYDKSQGFLTNSDLKYQEERRQRKVRRIQFEER